MPRPGAILPYLFLSRRVLAAPQWKYQYVPPSRGYRYNKKGGMKPHRKIPLDWRKIDHNPAKIPWDWIPEKWKEEQKVDYEYEQEVAKYMPEYQPKIRDTDHPDYHKEVLYKFTPQTRVIEGLKQALCLTKSVLFEELPASIQELQDTSSLPNQDERVTQVIKHAHLYEIDPRNLDMKGSYRDNMRKEFHIFPRQERFCPSIVENLIRLCETHYITSKNTSQRIEAKGIKSSAVARRICELNYDFASDIEKNWLVSFESVDGLKILSSTALSPFADSDEVEKAASMKSLDIYPVFPIVDLRKTQIYQTTITTGLREGFSHSHLHTLFILNLNKFKPDELYAQMVSQLFACLYSRAVEKYGPVPTDLQNPMCGQVIATDGLNFQFMCMQLNTTKLDTDTGIKNMVWIRLPEGSRSGNFLPLPLYQRCSHRVWQDPDYLVGYDPSVFQTFLAFWLNGA